MSTIKSRIKSQYDYTHFIVLGIVILGLSIKHLILFLVLIIYLVYLGFKRWETCRLLLVVISLFAIHFALKEVGYYLVSDNIKGVVIDVSKKDNHYQITIKNFFKKYQFNTKEKYAVGDYLLVDGQIQSYQKHYPFGFDYEAYLHYQNKKIVYPNQIKKIRTQPTFYYLHYAIKTYLNRQFSEPVLSYLKVLTIASSESFDQEGINKIGISHLFVISGLHVSLILGLLSKVIHLFTKNKKVEFIVSIIFLCGYLVITSFLVSVLRVAIGYLLKNKVDSHQLVRFSLNFIIIVLINPYYLFNNSFILSYAIYFLLSIYVPLFKTKCKWLDKMINLWVITLVIQIFTLPIVINFNPDFNLLSFVINPLYILFVSYIMLPMAFLTTLIPPLQFAFQYLVLGFITSVDYLASINLLIVPLGNINIYFKIAYYIIWYIVMRMCYLKKWHYLFVWLIVMLLWYFKGVFVLHPTVYFLDLAHGEATLIISPNTSRVILIDSGETDEIVDIIKNLGIKKIDLLIISHHDQDHIGGAFYLAKNVVIKTLLVSFLEHNQTIDHLKAYCANTIYAKASNQYDISPFSIKVLSPEIDMGNVNDNSLVCQIYINDTSFLFTGDISAKTEARLISQKINTTFYKVAHHGSNTSSSSSFLKSINFQYAIIMNGYYNKFGFPHEEVVKRFNHKQLLLTKTHQTIIIIVKRKHFVIQKHSRISFL